MWVKVTMDYNEIIQDTALKNIIFTMFEISLYLYIILPGVPENPFTKGDSFSKTDIFLGTPCRLNYYSSQ